MLVIMQNAFHQPYFKILWSVLESHQELSCSMCLLMFLNKLFERGVRVHQKRSYIQSCWEYKPNRLCQEKLIYQIIDRAYVGFSESLPKTQQHIEIERIWKRRRQLGNLKLGRSIRLTPKRIQQRVSRTQIEILGFSSVFFLIVSIMNLYEYYQCYPDLVYVDFESYYFVDFCQLIIFFSCFDLGLVHS